ncbi:MAG: O-antigen ligase family protein [Stellaceae bacterium]
MTLDTLLALGLLLSMGSQLRFGELPVGPGELCLAAWIVLTFGCQASQRGVTMTRPFTRMLTFWVVFAMAESLGTVNGYLIRDVHDTGLFLHDVLAYPLMAAIACLTLLGPRAEARLHRITWILAALGSLFLAPQLAAGWGIVHLPIVSPWFGDRFRGWSDNPNQLGLTCAILAFLALHLADAATSPAARIAALACSIVPICVGRLTKEDTFTFALIVGGPVFILMKLRDWSIPSAGRLTLRSAVALIALTGGALTSISIVPFAASVGGFANVGRGLMKDDGKEATREANLRLALWDEAIHRGLQAAMLGLGPGPHLPIPASIVLERVSTNPASEQVDRHPAVNGTPNFEAHNTLLDLFTQGGLISVVSLLWLIATALFTAYKAQQPGLVTLMCALCIFAMTGLIIRDPVFWLAVALCLAAGEGTRRHLHGPEMELQRI